MLTNIIENHSSFVRNRLSNDIACNNLFTLFGPQWAGTLNAKSAYYAKKVDKNEIDVCVDGMESMEIMLLPVQGFSLNTKPP